MRLRFARPAGARHDPRHPRDAAARRPRPRRRAAMGPGLAPAAASRDAGGTGRHNHQAHLIEFPATGRRTEQIKFAIAKISKSPRLEKRF